MTRINASQHLPSTHEDFVSPTKNGEGTPQGWGPHSPVGGNPASGGAPSSNTAPSNCIPPSDTTILRAGVDSLYLSYAGELSDSTRIKLDALQSLARSKEPDSQKLAQYPLEDHLFEVVSPRFGENQTLNSYDFFAIVTWKSNRTKTKIKSGLAASGKSVSTLMLR